MLPRKISDRSSDIEGIVFYRLTLTHTDTEFYYTLAAISRIAE